MSDDEKLARKLQAQFDQEAAEFLSNHASYTKLKSRSSHNKVHTVSDSEDTDGESDSKLDGSNDLFDASDKDSNRSVDVSGDKASNKESYQKPEKKLPVCPYGSKCYRKNPIHLKEYFHPRSPGKRKLDEREDRAESSDVNKKTKGASTHNILNKSPQDVYQEFQPFSFFLTKVADIPQKFNTQGAMSLKDILSNSMGVLRSSCHFNFMFDIKWLMSQYPADFRKLPVLLVHGEQGRSETDLKSEASDYANITLCRAALDIPYGTHHTKMMLLLYERGMRVVIHTANLIDNDWHQKTQGVWISPLFPPLKNSSDKGDSTTGFKADLLQYIAAYRSIKLTPWEKHIQSHDMSSANVYIIGSVPGRHTLNNKHNWGHLKLKKVLSERGPDSGLVKNWPLIGQFSSIGSLGPNKEAWLLNEWGQSISVCKSEQNGSLLPSKLNLIFPSLDNIRLSLEGYNGGGCVPYSIKTASKQPWLVQFFSQWVSEGRGRSKAVPHIKTYACVSPDGSQAAWFMVTSANLSKAAWGSLEKDKSQLMIRSYELGVLFLPQCFGCKNAFKVSSHLEEVVGTTSPVFPLPYDLPAQTYQKGDRPWLIDVPCMDKPDTFGTMWCPPL
ncbi:tyrosyl-DNA phosphodiesterase 1 [Biomphalaria glabrata]|nr:tyrosyl-DNA phosphodiesterase 1 [Biomphalaria glabrata]